MTETTLRARFVRFLARLLGVGRRPAAPAGFAPPMAVTPPAPPSPNAWLRLDSSQLYLPFHVGVQINHSTTISSLLPGQAFQIAKAAIQDRAERVSRRFPVTQPERVRAELSVALQERRPTGVDGVSAWAACIKVQVSEEDQAAMRQYEEAQKQKQRLGWQFGLIEYQMRQFGPLLADPMRATTWWFVQNLDKSEQLSTVATNFRSVQDLLRPPDPVGLPADEPALVDTPGRVLDDFDQDADPPARNLLYQQLRQMFDDYGRSDLVYRIGVLGGKDPDATGLDGEGGEAP